MLKPVFPLQTGASSDGVGRALAGAPPTGVEVEVIGGGRRGVEGVGGLKESGRKGVSHRERR